MHNLDIFRMVPKTQGHDWAKESTAGIMHVKQSNIEIYTAMVSELNDNRYIRILL